jgi:hypothetical protein
LLSVSVTKDPISDPDSVDVFDVAARVEEDSFPELQDALGKTANATEALVHKLIESGGSDQSLSLKSSHFVELQQSQTEVRYQSFRLPSSR